MIKTTCGLRLTPIFLIIYACFLLPFCTTHPELKAHQSSYTHVTFNNEIKQNDTLNVLDKPNIFNGGGVGTGDFNNDGLTDLYLTGNMVSNKLYLNRKNFQFEDVTSIAGVDGLGRWSRGVSVVDINHDGLADLYVCATLSPDPEKRKNLLYINSGVDKKGIPHFTESAEEYGLADTSHSTMACFFDYDRDGDLDVFIATNEIPKGALTQSFRKRITDGTFPSTGRLYANTGTKNGHPFYTNVSARAGITIEGYSHNALVLDINHDGWKDIYVTNDFLSSNVLYINNHNGTFTDRSREYFKHTSLNSMGSDFGDLNNDGLDDIIEADMNPEDNYRKKTMLNPGNYNTYQNFDYYGYQYQYVRNTLQLNQGNIPPVTDSSHPVFSEIGLLSGIAETDWSWAPMIADLDNDGFRDIFITNGYPMDVTDHDFIAFRDEASNIASKEMLLSRIPEVKLPNYVFKNNGDLTFTNMSFAWTSNEPSFSNGAAYADLDNDGDLDIVINNINDQASVYENKLTAGNDAHHFINIRAGSPHPDITNLGAIIKIFYGAGKQQVFENTPYRGYLSSMEPIAHFGLGKFTKVDSVEIIWPDQHKQRLYNIDADQTMIVNKPDGADESEHEEIPGCASIFKDVTGELSIRGAISSKDYNDFDAQRLLPHKLSEYGAAIATGDVDGDGLDDIIIPAGEDASLKTFLQQKNGKFIERLIDDDTSASHLPITFLLLFDCDGDKDLDLYAAMGGNDVHMPALYYDRLYINDGKGTFTYDPMALPQINSSNSCVRAGDFDNDGDLDLFVGGRNLPGKYPMPVSSFVYRNDTKNGKIKFTNVTKEVAPPLQNIGMVTDGMWTDFNKDGWNDLIVVGEWMPISFYENKHGKFESIETGTGDATGWWNSIISADIDNDGDTDYVVGNNGENCFYKPRDGKPIHIYAADFDHNGRLDIIPTLFIKDRHGSTKEFTLHGRDEIVDQLPAMKRQFLTYKAFAEADVSQLFSKYDLRSALTLSANTFKSVVLVNDGNAHYILKPLPAEAQVSCLFGMIAQDVNADGNIDLILNGNDFGNEVFIGRYDALNGLVLIGDGHGNFRALKSRESGIYIPGNGRMLTRYRRANGKMAILATQHNGSMRFFE
jgi:hypothetical protein